MDDSLAFLQVCARSPRARNDVIDIKLAVRVGCDGYSQGGELPGGARLLFRRRQIRSALVQRIASAANELHYRDTRPKTQRRLRRQGNFTNGLLGLVQIF